MKTAASIAVLLLAAAATPGPALAAMTISSADIEDGGVIGPAYIHTRCGGQNVSPPLSWNGVPPEAKSLVLTVIDVDVKPAQWSHWIVVDLPVATTKLTRGVKTLPGPAKGVASNFGDALYDGPCPPQGSGAHRYQFTIWAMPSATTAIKPDANAAELSARLAKTALGQASFTGTLSR